MFFIITGPRQISENGRKGDDRDQRQRNNVQKRLNKERLQQRPHERVSSARTHGAARRQLTPRHQPHLAFRNILWFIAESGRRTLKPKL